MEQVSRDEQKALSPAEAHQRLIDGNERFPTGKQQPRDLLASSVSAAGGHYPASVVISCLDARTAPEFIFDQGPGDLFVGRIAGNFVDDVMLGSVEFATKVSNAPLIVVLGHTECGAVKGACDGVKLGHLTATLSALTPALDAVPKTVQPRTSANKTFLRQVTEANVRVTVARIRERSDDLSNRNAKGSVGIIGGVDDLATGRIEWLTDTAATVTAPTPNLLMRSSGTEDD